MIILKFLPDGFWYLLLLLGILGYLLTEFLPNFKFVKPSKIFAAIVIAASFYFIGALHNNQAWQARVSELKDRVAQAELESTKSNAAIETKVVTKTQLVRERGQDIVRYIDKEVVKYDSTCVIPKEFVQAHNTAAKEPK